MARKSWQRFSPILQIISLAAASRLCVKVRYTHQRENKKRQTTQSGQSAFWSMLTVAAARFFALHPKKIIEIFLCHPQRFQLRLRALSLHPSPLFFCGKLCVLAPQFLYGRQLFKPSLPGVFGKKLLAASQTSIAPAFAA